MKIRRALAGAFLLGATLVVAGCGGDGGGSDNGGQVAAAPERLKFAQTWGTAPGSASQTATVPYFPSVANQTTGVTAPGVAVLPALTPPAGTTTTAAVFANATIRQFFRVSVGGNSVRVRLSNLYSPADLVIDEVHVALADRAACQPPVVPVAPATVQATRGPTCSNIVPTSDRVLTLNGVKSFTIPKGQEIYTDDVPLVVPALGDVAVSFYVKNATPGLTTHATAFTTTYFAVGLSGTTANYTGATAFDTRTIGGQAALATSSSFYVASGVDVTVPQATRVVIGFGDSITDGTNTIQDTSTRWTDVLAARFRAQAQGDGKPQVAMSNAGIGGNKVATDNVTASFGIAGTTRFKSDVLSRTGLTDVIVLEGVNDITQAAVPTPTATVIAAYRDLIRQAHAAGVKIYFATIVPIRTDLATDQGTYGGVTGSPALFALREPLRQELNQWILTSTEHDGAIDFNAATSPPGRLNQLIASYNVSYTNGTYDQLHPNAAGLAAMAGAVNLASFR